MGEIRLSGGGIPANVRAGEHIPADRFWKYSAIENEVELCGSGEEADGFCLVATEEDELLNAVGQNQSRKQTGIYGVVTVADFLTAGDEIMSNASGEVIAYTNSGDNRALGKALETITSGSTGRILIYSK